MSTQHGNEENTSAGTGDPWIDAYRAPRGAVVAGWEVGDLLFFVVVAAK